MEQIDLAFEQYRLPDKINRLIQDCKKTGDEINSRDAGAIDQFEPADGRICWNLLNSVKQQVFTDHNAIFCEWGSGLGLVTLIASTIGLDATGIEIEGELVDLACEFSIQHAIPASFIHASIYPEDNAGPVFDYGNVDLFFAYPWPGEITKMMNLFNRVAAGGAVLVCYHGGQNFRVHQR